MERTSDESNPDSQSNSDDDGDAEPLPREACAWCGRVLREGPEPTSHGICPDCLARLEDSVKRPNVSE